MQSLAVALSVGLLALCVSATTAGTAAQPQSASPQAAKPVFTDADAGKTFISGTGSFLIRLRSSAPAGIKWGEPVTAGSIQNEAADREQLNCCHPMLHFERFTFTGTGGGTIKIPVRVLCDHVATSDSTVTSSSGTLQASERTTSCASL